MMRTPHRCSLAALAVAAVLTAGTIPPAAAGVAPAASESSSAATDWSTTLINSAMTRQNDTIMASWQYPAGLYLHGEYLTYRRTGNRKYLEYVKSYVDKYVDGNGRLNVTLNTLDNMMPGQLLLDLYQETHDARYRTAATTIRTRLTSYPRTTDQGFIHKTSLPGQLWADGTYMSLPFLARYASLVGEDSDAYTEAARQLQIYDSHLRRPDGLLWHGYDEKRQQKWADPTTGLSSQPWCRAIGWMAMATVDVLEELPADHAGRPALVAMVNEFAEGFQKYQDPATGRWFQVVDRGGAADNWTETSCSSMYTYLLSRGVERGYLDSSYRSAAENGYRGVLNRISVNAQGAVSLTDISAGTSVGDYAYYVARPRNTNDMHGLGAFLIMNEQMVRAGT